MSSDLQLRQSLLSYLQLVQRLGRQRRLIGLVFAGGCFLALIAAFVIPATYRSSTLILVQPQKLPSSYVQSAITLDLGERLRTLTPQIMSRTRLEQIIRKFDLYGEGSDPKEMERRVEHMRRAIDVQVKGEDTFRIYYEHRSAELSQKVAQELARLFIEENLRDRAQQAISTSEFLDSELTDLKRQLETQEAALRTYKERHIGVLPEQQQANLRSLDRFQSQYQANGEALQTARNRRMAIEAQLTARTGESNVNAPPSEPQLEKLRAELNELRGRFTDNHPDVRRLNRQISDMEGKLAQLREVGADISGRSDPYTRSILDKMGQVDREIAQLEEEQRVLADNIQIYQRRIDRLPEVEEKMTLLTRDYETTRQNYQALLNKKFEAKLSINLEKKQQDELFKILDPAYLPVAPVRPRRDLILVFGILASLAIGLGAAFVVVSLDTRIRTEDDLAVISKLPVLTVIPRIPVRSPVTDPGLELPESAQSTKGGHHA